MAKPRHSVTQRLTSQPRWMLLSWSLERVAVPLGTLAGRFSPSVTLSRTDVGIDGLFGELRRAEQHWEHPSLSGILLGHCHAGNNWKPWAPSPPRPIPSSAAATPARTLAAMPGTSRCCWGPAGTSSQAAPGNGPPRGGTHTSLIARGAVIRPRRPSAAAAPCHPLPSPRCTPRHRAGQGWPGGAQRTPPPHRQEPGRRGQTGLREQCRRGRGTDADGSAILMPTGPWY